MVKTNKQIAKLHKAAMECIKHLVIAKGFSLDKAEEAVLATLKESESYIKAGLINETIQSLQMIHMDKTPEAAASSLIKSLLK